MWFDFCEVTWLSYISFFFSRKTCGKNFTCICATVANSQTLNFSHKVQNRNYQIRFKCAPSCRGSMPTVPQLFIFMPTENITVVFTVSAALYQLPSRLQTHPCRSVQNEPLWGALGGCTSMPSPRYINNPLGSHDFSLSVLSCIKIN